MCVCMRDREAARRVTCSRMAYSEYRAWVFVCIARPLEFHLDAVNNNPWGKRRRTSDQETEDGTLLLLYWAGASSAEYIISLLSVYAIGGSPWRLWDCSRSFWLVGCTSCCVESSQDKRAPLGAREGEILYGEDESGPCAGDERTGQGAQSCPFLQRGQQRIMGGESGVWSRPPGPHHQAETSKCVWLLLTLPGLRQNFDSSALGFAWHGFLEANGKCYRSKPMLCADCVSRLVYGFCGGTIYHVKTTV